ncbi:MAG: metal ABC transporter permease [Planctomycetota bacterium]|nr:MAG: metal ABC transporter permease [Planctomycetota bacterium]
MIFLPSLPCLATFLIPYNTVVVATGVAAIGFAAGVVGCFAVLRRRALAGDAAAHATLAGVAFAFLCSGGRRDLSVLLAGALVAAVGALGVLVLLRRWTRTRDDAATAIVLSVSFGLGITLVSGLTARGVPGSAGLEQFLLGHTAGLTRADALMLGGLSLAVVTIVVMALKEATLVAFDPAFAAASGWPVGIIDYSLVVLVAVMVVVGLPAAGAVLVTALVVIPPVAARQWTDRVGVMLLLAGLIGLAAALAGVATSALVPKMPTGPLVVIAAGGMLVISLLAAPQRGWLARWLRGRGVKRDWAEGRLLTAALRLEDEAGPFTHAALAARAPGGRGAQVAFKTLVATGAIRATEGDVVPVESRMASTHRLASTWRLSRHGRDRATERARRMAVWTEVLEVAREDARGHLTMDVPAPETVIEAVRLAAIRASGAEHG